MEYKHCDNNEKHIILHDCTCEKAYLENGVLGFEFEDGFWVSHEHPESNLSTLVRTDSSKAEFVLGRESEFDVTIYIFKKSFFGVTVRKEITIEKLIDDINSEKYALEFLYQYIDDEMRIVECDLSSKKKLRFAECQIKMYTPKVNYYWNNLCEDRVW